MVYIFLADGFETVEALAPLDAMRRADIDVRTVGVTGIGVTSSHGVCVNADIPLSEVALDGAEMLVLPGGGTGTENLSKCAALRDLIARAHDAGVMLAAICAAPTVLADMGLLKGRRAVCYPSCEKQLADAGAIVQIDEEVTHDNHIITGRAAGSSLVFGIKLVAMLRGWIAAERIRKSMLVRSDISLT